MDVPVGADEHDNVEYRRFGEAPSLGFAAKQHFEIGEGAGRHGLREPPRSSPARGSSVLKRGIARLERAIGQFMLDLHTNEHGYTEVAPPLLVRDEVMFGTAQLPKFEEDQFATRRQPLTSGYVTSDVLIPLSRSLSAARPDGADADVLAAVGQDSTPISSTIVSGSSPRPKCR